MEQWNGTENQGKSYLPLFHFSHNVYFYFHFDLTIEIAIAQCKVRTIRLLAMHPLGLTMATRSLHLEERYIHQAWPQGCATVSLEAQNSAHSLSPLTWYRTHHDRLRSIYWSDRPA
ncbi:hypothetical protein PoB_007642100 [Plakobranchus ocellatus]|uniref:Uncharacterized protein n=1 Tax=Plakobranchus ocellatus TaxID=259542 RepID=A0AAV4E1H4_9GAST|nr:hypothetical protein PoB_007642100 [Plakobranchus ocellatus]